MKKNVIMIVLDSLSKWYIDQMEEDSFFSNMEKSSYCAANMYASGPFTEAAIRGLWESADPVTGNGLLGGIEKFRAMPFFELFQKNGYKDIYMDYPMLLSTDELRRREIQGTGWVGDTVLDRLKYYAELKQKGELRSGDYRIIGIWLEHWFDIYRHKEKAPSEYALYLQNKRRYIDELLEDELRQENFRDEESEPSARSYLSRAERVENKPLSDSESKLESLVRHKNIQYIMSSHHYDRETVNLMLGQEVYNKDLATGDNVMYSMRRPISNIREDFEHFWEWHDNRTDIEGPFLAYIHDSSFHLPESFMDRRYGEAGYEEEIWEKVQETELLPFQKMSVMKQLSLRHISKNLNLFWKELEKRALLENTYVIITADHGSANTIYCRPESKWNYSRRVFQVPFYMTGPDITPHIDYGFHMAQDILPTLIDRCGLDTYGNHYMGHNIESGGDEYAFSTWVHGAFDLYRQEIKMGIRNERYSINCIGYITQFFGSCRFTACDLMADPDEADDVYESVREREDFINLYKKLQNRWFEIIFDVLTDQENPWDFSEKYGFLVDKKEKYREFNESQKRYPREKFEKELKEKQVVIVGTDEELEVFLKNFGYNYQVKEVWDINPQKLGTSIFGHNICMPHADIDQSNTLFVVTGRQELELKEYLDDAGIRDYLYWRLIGQGDI